MKNYYLLLFVVLFSCNENEIINREIQKADNVSLRYQKASLVDAIEEFSTRWDLLPESEFLSKTPLSDQVLSKSSKFKKIIFRDEFNQKRRTPDFSKWELCPRLDGVAWGQHLSESYDQVYVENGKLVILAEKVNGVYKAGGVQTFNKFDFQYGRVEVKAKFTKSAKGAWPAIWMMPSKAKYDGGWPTVGEIDIMEQLNKEGIVHHTIHSNYKNNRHMYVPVPSKTTRYRKNKYNIYALEWTADKLIFFVNNRKVLTYPNLKLKNEQEVKQWPFEAPFYLILNNALGGKNTWPGVIKDTDLPAKMEIDWVRIYQ